FTPTQTPFTPAVHAASNGDYEGLPRPAHRENSTAITGFHSPNPRLNLPFLRSRLGCGRRLGLLRSDFALQARFAATTGAGPPQHNRGGNKDGGVSPDDNTDDNCEREVAQNRTAEKE